jgi:hypothetical protein
MHTHYQSSISCLFFLISFRSKVLLWRREVGRRPRCFLVATHASAGFVLRQVTALQSHLQLDFCSASMYQGEAEQRLLLVMLSSSTHWRVSGYGALKPVGRRHGVTDPPSWCGTRCRRRPRMHEELRLCRSFYDCHLTNRHSRSFHRLRSRRIVIPYSFSRIDFMDSGQLHCKVPFRARCPMALRRSLSCWSWCT